MDPTESKTQPDIRFSPAAPAGPQHGDDVGTVSVATASSTGEPPLVIEEAKVEAEASSLDASTPRVLSTQVSEAALTLVPPPESTAASIRQAPAEETQAHPALPTAPGWNAKAGAAAVTAATAAAAAAAATPAPASPPEYPMPEKKQPKNPFALDPKTKTKIKHFWRIFSYSTKWERFMIGVAVLASMITGITMPMVIFVFAGIFGSMTGYDKNAAIPTTMQELENALKDAFMAGIVQSVLYLIYIFAVRLVCAYIASYLFRITSLRIVAAIRLEYMRAVFSQSVSVLDTLPPGQTAAVITVSASILQAGISEKLATFIQSITLVVAGLVISLIFSWKLTLVTCSGMVFILITYSITTPFLVRGWGRVQESEIKASTAVNEIFSSLRMVAAFGAEEKMMKRYEEWIGESKRRGLKLSPIVASQQSPAFFAIYATFALTFWYALRLYMSGGIDNPQALVIVLFNVIMMTSSISGVTGPISAAAQAAGAAMLFYIGIDVPRPSKGGLTAPDVSAKGDIVLSKVNFTYPSRPDIKVLDDLSITFPAGKTTAIVGPSGSGKSTIVALLERWYDLINPETHPLMSLLRNGSITTGGTQLRDMDVKWWRAQIGLVQQEPVLFNDTILRNVEHGLVGSQWENASSEVKKRLVEEACREAFAEEYILRLPEGYDTLVGDAGIKLSGGQRQRLAIARAIISKPSVLILDEATSAIDVRGEQIVQAALDRAAEGRTTIIIAHRLSTIKKAHSIAVIRTGRLVEQGTHEELMAIEGGVYHILASGQKLTSEEDEVEKEEVTDASRKSKEAPELDVEGSAWDASTAVGRDNDFEEESKKGIIGSFGLLLREQSHLWRWYLALLFAALVAGASAPVQAYLFAMLISLFGYMFFPDLLTILSDFWCLMFTVLAISVGLSYFVLGWASNTTSFNITHHYRREYLRNMLAKPVSYFDFETHSIGAMTARLATDPAALQQLLGMNMAFVLISFLSVAGCLAISFAFGWKLAAVTVLTSLPVIMGAAFFRVRQEAKYERANNAVFAESAKFAAESVAAFRTVAALTLEDSICGRYEKLLSEHVRAARRKTAVSTFLFALSDSIAVLCMALILWYGGKLLAEREYYPVQYVIIYMAVMLGGMGAGQWLSYGPNIAQAKIAANRIIGMRSTDNNGEAASRDETDGTGESGSEKGARVQFRDLWFRYPTRDVPILNGLNLTIENGQFVGIVGPSGSGKTTIISLIERFYRPNAGHILFNSSDISTTPLRPYRAAISLVAQESTLFAGTLRDNILMGISDPDSVPDTVLRQACSDAGLDAFLAWLPEGLETYIGNRGNALSGGQRQRIAVARALVRNPALLLLDEATSSLDSVTERAVLEGLQRAKGSRTMMVVAHRLATVQRADVIIVMGDGKVLEKGDHMSLLKLRGVYYQMCQAQALDG